MILGRFQHVLHEAETGAKHQLVALPGQISRHALGVWAFGHAFDDAGLHPVAKLGFNRLAAIVVGKGPATIAHGAYVDETDFERALHGAGRCGRRGRSRCRRAGCAGLVGRRRTTGRTGRQHQGGQRAASGAQPMAFMQIGGFLMVHGISSK